MEAKTQLQQYHYVYCAGSTFVGQAAATRHGRKQFLLYVVNHGQVRCLKLTSMRIAIKARIQTLLQCTQPLEGGGRAVRQQELPDSPSPSVWMGTLERIDQGEACVGTTQGICSTV